jgi:hypothetical protein
MYHKLTNHQLFYKDQQSRQAYAFWKASDRQQMYSCCPDIQRGNQNPLIDEGQTIQRSNQHPLIDEGQTIQRSNENPLIDEGQTIQ